MGQFKPGNPGGPGRKRKADKFARPIAKAEKQIADQLPQLIENMLHLAHGGYERIEEEWQPAGLVYVGSGESARRAFPELPSDQPVLVKRKRSIADKDRQANEYLINRILGKPIERQELSAAIDAAIQLTPVDYRAGLDALKPDDADA
jgi:hypothetical protein